MSIATFTTATLIKVVRQLSVPSSFLLDLCFREEQMETTEEIHFDVESDKQRIAPFVSPLVEGKVMTDLGFVTKSFKPAYVKDKRHFDADRALKRTIGETIGGNLTPQQRADLNLRRSLEDQIKMITRRLEVMSSEALREGQVTVSGENYPTQVVNFGRDASLSITKSVGSKWGDAGVKPLEDIDDWVQAIHDVSGASPTVCVMDPSATRKFKADDDVKDKLDNRRGTLNAASVELGPQVRGQGNEKAYYIGTIGQIDFWSYQDTYVDEAGATQKMMPDDTVLLLSPGQIEGARCFGAIRDERAGFQAMPYFPKTWFQEDPAVRWLMMQSAPLVVPYRTNATLRANI